MTTASVQTLPAADNIKAAESVVRVLEPKRESEWDRFVSSQPSGSFFMLSGWKRVIEKTFHYQPRYYYLEKNGEIVATAPLFLVSNWMTGRCLISVPFGVYAGICAKDAESEQVLLDHLKQVAANERVEYLELRARSGPIFEGFHHNPLYSTFTTELLPNHEANLKKLPKDTRYMIRKAEKAGLRSQHGWEQLDKFYPLFAQNLRNHGTPAFPRQLFDHFPEEFDGQLDLMIVYAGEAPVAGVVSFIFGDAILPYYSGAAPDAPRLGANNFLYWSLMKSAVEKGLHVFDFGRSKQGTGSFAFKTQWNMMVEPLQYQVHLVKRKTVPNFSPLNPKFQLATRVWQRLPLSLTTALGPRLIGLFP